MDERRGVEAAENPEETVRVIPARPAFSPAVGMFDDHKRLLWHKNLTIVVCGAALLVAALTVWVTTREQKIIILDPVGGLLQGPVEPLAASKGYFLITTINATQAALQRSSVGYDLKEILPIYFSPRARKVLDEDLTRRMDDIKRRRLSMKPVIERVTPPQEAGDGRAVRVTGRLQVTGLVNGRLFYDEPPYELVLLYRRNSDLSNRAAMPWVADELEIAVGASELQTKKSKRH